MIKLKFFQRKQVTKVILWSDGKVCERVFITDENLESIKVIEDTKNKIKIKNLFVVVDVPDFFESEINIPEVSDTKIKEIIIKKKLSENFEDKEFFVAYDFKKKGKIKVFTLPKSIIDELLKRYELSKLNILTNIPLALASLVEKILPDKSVLTAFTINNRFYLIFSKNKEIEFVRIISMPEHSEVEEERLNFLYENLQTTYFFLYQREKKQIDMILLSGEHFIKFKGKLKEKLENLDLRNFKFIDDIFNQENTIKDVVSIYTPCIGALFTEYKFNFIPYEIIRERNIKKFLSISLLMLLGLFIILSSFTLFKFNSIYNKRQSIENLILKIKNKRRKTIKSLFGNKENLSYLISYVSLIGKAKRENPLYLLNYTNSLLDIIGYKNGNFDYYFKDGNIYLSVRFRKEFKSIKEIFMFENKLMEELNKIRKASKNKIHIERINLRRNYNNNSMEGILVIREIE